jgi:hypothetical protein
VALVVVLLLVAQAVAVVLVLRAVKVLAQELLLENAVERVEMV